MSKTDCMIASMKTEMKLRVHAPKVPNTRTPIGTKMVCINAKGNESLVQYGTYYLQDISGSDMIIVENETNDGIFARPSRFVLETK